MKRCKTPSFVLTLPLSYEEWQKYRLDTLFRVCGQMSNNLIYDRRKALEQLKRTKRWKEVQASISALHDKHDGGLIDDNAFQKLVDPWHKKRNTLLSEFGFSEYVFQARMKKMAEAS